LDQVKQQVAKQNNPVVSPGAKPLFFQPKLSINQPNDAYEQEADHMADQVMRMPDPLAKHDSFFRPAGKTIQRKCAHCEQEEKMLHRKESSAGEVEGSSQLAGYVSSLNTAGQSLSAGSRKFFEPRFGHDFSNVRIHTDSGAVQSAQSINALAYTTGNNIVFNSGQYSLETATGQRLMAHELTHVVQQGGGKSQVQKQTDVGAGTPTQEHGDLTMIPENVKKDCNISETSPADEQRINYETSSFSLNDATRAVLDDFVKRWTADGTNKLVRIDGYASTSGTEDQNWGLSCSRAKSTLDELMHPSNGIPGIPQIYLSVYAHGATNRFSQAQLLPNQTATLTSEIKIVPPPIHVDPVPDPVPVVPKEPDADEKKCGPDITASIGTLLSSVSAYFATLSWFQKRRSCMALDADALLAGVNPIMAWDTNELFLPNTGPLIDHYFYRFKCGSPRDKGCDTDSTRNLCEKEDGCGNTVEVGGKCMLAGTANYALYGRMFKLCNDEFSPDFPRWDMRAMIGLYKTVSLDDSTPPKEMATSAFDGTFPAVPAAVENRGDCKAKCGKSYGGKFGFVWEPYQSR